MARGGYMGGGRKKLPPEQKRKAVTFMLPPDTHEELKRKAEAAGLSIGRYLETLINQAP